MANAFPSSLEIGAPDWPKSRRTARWREARRALRSALQIVEVPWDVAARRVSDAMMTPRAILQAHGRELERLGMPVASIYASAAAQSVDHALKAIERQVSLEAAQSLTTTSFSSGRLSDWL